MSKHLNREGKRGRGNRKKGITIKREGENVKKEGKILKGKKEA